MRVLLLDPLNTQNNFYTFAKYLREAGVDAHVAMVHKNQLPESHQPHSSLDGWVHSIETPYTSNLLQYRRSYKEMRQLAERFDVIMCSGHTPMWVQGAGVPFIYFSYGSDLDQEAVRGWSGRPRKLSILEKLRSQMVKRRLTQALRKASAVVISPYQVPVAMKLGLKNIRFLPHIIDTGLFKPAEDREEMRKSVRLAFNCDLLLFHPTRQVWADRGTADCKGNDIVFKAFTGFLNGYSGRAKLVVIEKGWDLGASKYLIDELGIESKVVWLQPMPRNLMARWYNIADVVLDQFVVGVLALVAVEAMACGTPVISYVKEDTELIYPAAPPVLNAPSGGNIHHWLKWLVDGGSERTRVLGDDGRNWVVENCSPEASVPRYVELLEEVYAQARG